MSPITRFVPVLATAAALAPGRGAPAAPGPAEQAAPAAAREATVHQWNLTEIYADDDAWRAAFARLEKRLPTLEAFQGKLGQGAGYLAAALENFYDMERELSRLYSYAAMRSDADTREPSTLEMKQQAQSLATRFGQAASFIDPEILALPEGTVQAYMEAEPRLTPYRHAIEDLLRRAPHILDRQGERLIATSGLMADTAQTAYRILTAAEIPWPTVTLSDGKEVRLDQSAYTRYRALPNREDRKRVFEAFWGTWAQYRRTVGVTLYSQLKADHFYAQARNYPSCLERALGADNVPVAVYRTLVQATNENLGTLHRYLRLRARMLGIDDLRYHDIYPPLVSGEFPFPIEAGKQLVLEAVRPLGEAYVDVVREGFASRWMDVFPREGKRPGAYSNGSVYDVHPYVLMNYNDDYESVSTLAHEWGHAMHSYLTNTNQPYATSDYAIFVAEVASTFNEALLLDDVLKKTKSDEERLFYLGSALEGLRQTFFRQAMFAEFELATHERVEKGEALSGDSLTQIYGDILRKYHGHDAGVMTIDDAYAVEWAYIPHFYYNFYVYKYATSLAASSLFARDVLEGKEGARERYLSVLKAGGSEYPYELLKNAGVDLATREPYEALMRRMNDIMDQIEVILDERAGSAASASR